MLGSLRKPPLIIALVLFGLILLAELGTALAVPFVGSTGRAAGKGIPMLALLDIQLVFTALLMVAPLLFPASITGRLQGVATVVVALILISAGTLAGLAAFRFLSELIGLLITPFGIGLYISRDYDDFPVGAAAATLGFIMSCKLGSIAALIIAHQRFLQNKGLMLMIGTSLLATVLLSFLHGFVPGFLVSVTDAIGAIVVAILGLIWAIFGLIFGTIAVIRALG